MPHTTRRTTHESETSMATAAQRDRQITAAEKRRDKAQEKVTKAESDLAEFRKVVKVQTDRIDWLRSMPVDDAPDGNADEDETTDDGADLGPAPDEDDQPL